MERLLCLWLYHRYRYGLHARRVLWLSAKRNFLGQHLPRALSTVPSWFRPRKRSRPCQQKRDRVLPSVISQWWTLHGRILEGTTWVDQWNSIYDQSLHGCIKMKKTTTTKQKKNNPLRQIQTRQNNNTHPRDVCMTGGVHYTPSHTNVCKFFNFLLTFSQLTLYLNCWNFAGLLK